jgi:cephalosporin hydroxylase
MSNFNQTGYFEYKNLIAMQSNLAFEMLDSLLESERFDNVIEIGTAFGGLCLFLYERSQEYNYNFLSFDIADRIGIENLNIENRKIMDVFCDEAVVLIKDRIKEGKTLILCDGGNKIAEFNYFSKLLKSGDFIMAHDYAESSEYFNCNIKDVYWNWCEITDTNISESLAILQKYIKIDFCKSAWLCCIID